MFKKSIFEEREKRNEKEDGAVGIYIKKYEMILEVLLVLSLVSNWLAKLLIIHDEIPILEIFWSDIILTIG